jgi:malate dehydrogenase
VKVVVVANPANTNALILSENAPSIPKCDISCLTRLDHNRALGQISQRLQCAVSDVRNVIIWGNHSSTQYPDVNHGTVTRPDGLTLPIRTAVCDDAWLQVSSLRPHIPPLPIICYALSLLTKVLTAGCACGNPAVCSGMACCESAAASQLASILLRDPVERRTFPK